MRNRSSLISPCSAGYSPRSGDATVSLNLRPEDKGVLPDRMIAALVKSGAIIPAGAIDDDQIQPASIDLRLGEIAYRVRASFLPGPDSTVGERIDELKLHEIPLGDGAVLETGCVYIVPLMESLSLPPDIAAFANPKSSTGRLDVFTRVIADQTRGFDRIDAGYHGPLYAEISPRAFPVLVREGSRLSQLRFRHGQAVVAREALAALHRSPGRRIPRSLRGLLRPWLRPCGCRRPWLPCGAGSAFPGGAVHYRAQPDRRPAGVRAHAGTA